MGIAQIIQYDLPRLAGECDNGIPQVRIFEDFVKLCIDFRDLPLLLGVLQLCLGFDVLAFNQGQPIRPIPPIKDIGFEIGISDNGISQLIAEVSAGFNG